MTVLWEKRVSEISINTEPKHTEYLNTFDHRRYVSGFCASTLCIDNMFTIREPFPNYEELSKAMKEGRFRIQIVILPKADE